MIYEKIARVSTTALGAAFRRAGQALAAKFERNHSDQLARKPLGCSLGALESSSPGTFGSSFDYSSSFFVFGGQRIRGATASKEPSSQR